ncbi:hypothetical protein ACIQTZ_07265 [Paenarthrobacter sp. NPDC090520]|uniref:hypothetical protein n=1 Tax=Paenarthrobacter sp. NPDC090520 TaxID=3364382 RepID=UPI0037FC146C
MNREVASGALLLMVAPLLAGCLGDYSAFGDCNDLANEISHVIEKSIGSAPSLNSARGDGGMTPWCRIDFTTTDEYAADDKRLSALKTEVEAGMANWSRGIVVTIHGGNERSIEVLSPGEQD